jgi:ABC-type multidrug transport system ATPase subunit
LRRFGIAIALIGSPQILIVDEPTAGLDPSERNRFHRVLADVAAAAVVLLSTHIVDDVENLCGRLSILNRGRVIAEGTPTELSQVLAGRTWTRAYVRGEAPPDDAVNVSATPTGTRAVVVRDEAPGDGFVAHAPRLEDAYHHLLAQSERGQA